MERVNLKGHLLLLKLSRNAGGTPFAEYHDSARVGEYSRHVQRQEPRGADAVSR